MSELERNGKFSYRIKFVVLAAAFVAVFFGSFIFGRYAVGFTDLVKILANRLPFVKIEQTWTDAAETVAINVRMPRIIAAAVIGAALSTAGASYQGMFRNPMVSPDILGASTGAGFGAAIGILMGFNYVGITISSFGLGLAAVFLAYVISRASRLNGTLSMVLAGIMVSSLFSAGTSFIKLIADTQNQLPAITYWLMGSLNSIKGSDALFVSVVVAVGLIPLILLKWRINLLTVSEDEAKSLGINTGRLRFVVIICATLVTAAAVSVSGMIGWVGLVIPHFCRLLFGYDYRRIIPSSILLGGAFMMVVDNLARTVTTGELPLGVLTAFVGAPVFVWLILRGGASDEN
ncbi:MAG: iron ABC transporter permease [Oscillospiraceae bacterium]|jgi:iron complex transport system permease protein|nr:iron ABC transporter permease [Oscillospiraceae bacterium]